MCNLGEPLTVGEMLDALAFVPPDALIRFTSWDRHGEVVTFTVHRADYPARGAEYKDASVWLSFDAFKPEACV